MIPIGTKVTPLRKDIGCTLETSHVWNMAKEMGQNYLYVIENRRLEGRNALTLYYKKITDLNGDYFLEEDVIEYNKVITPEEFFEAIMSE